MDATTEATEALGAADTLHGSRILAAIKDSGIEFVLSVPDIVTSAGCRRRSPGSTVAPYSDLQGGRVRQHRGRPRLLLEARADSDPAHGPTRFDQRHSRRRDRIRPAGLPDGGLTRARGPTAAAAVEAPWRAHRRANLDAIGITDRLIEPEADVAKIRPAIDQAYRQSQPVALLIGRSPAP
jgi:hypothetical protein